MAPERPGQPVRISPDDLRVAIGLGTAPAVIDVRTADEYAGGHVPGALNVPFWRVLSAGIPAGIEKAERVVVYCGYGPRAQMAMLGLRLRGYSNLAELEGHWAEWRRRQLPATEGNLP